MQEDPPVATVPGNRLELLRLFSKHSVPGFAVVKQGTRKLAGIVLRSDLLRHPKQNQTALLMDPNPGTIYALASVQEAARQMVAARVPLLPVVSGANDLMGIVTTVDMLDVLTNHTGRVQAHLRRRVVPVHRSTPARTAKDILDITGTPALPVLDDNGKLIGIVTDADLLQKSAIRQSLERTQVGVPSDEDEWNREGLRNVRNLAHPTSELQLPAVSVDKLMVGRVRAVRPMTLVGEAAKVMLDGGLSQLPVVDESGRLLDLLTDLDLVGALV